MLILSRKPAESIVIGGSEITIKVLEICGNRVKLGVAAPRSVRVARQEIAHRAELPAGVLAGAAALGSSTPTVIPAE